MRLQYIEQKFQNFINQTRTNLIIPQIEPNRFVNAGTRISTTIFILKMFVHSEMEKIAKIMENFLKIILLIKLPK